ncbi:16S rRNA (guanine(527)-N(7))-methyltransferase RsmG [bacterium]|nr:16S rRNA (guanine(527)-N(7))-methyltransferase RsmG [bacterium]
MYQKLEQLCIKLSNENIQLIEKFSKYFLDYNSKVNLISKNDSNFLFEKHIFDSLAFNLFYTKYLNSNKEIKLMDIGTGGGFPALPIAFYYKNINVLAVDSINKKINFINTTAKDFDLKNITGTCKRVEELNSNLRESFDIITTRAMARLNIVLEYAIPYLKTNGFFIAYKSIKTEEEIQEAKNALKILNAKIIEKIEYSLPIDEENKRILIIIKKNAQTPKQYPRQNGLVKKNPL